jgi:hypothetical protein
MNTQYEFTQYAKPIMAPIQAPKTVYSPQEWANMTNTEPNMGYDVAYQISQDTQNLYKQLNQDMDIQSMYLHGSPSDVQNRPNLNTDQTPQKSNQVVMAGADWCYFTKQAKTKLSKTNHNIGILQCQTAQRTPGKDAQHPACQATRGFPSFYKKESNQSYTKVQNGAPQTQAQWDKLLN